MSETESAEPTPKKVGLGSKRGPYKTKAKSEATNAAVLTEALARIAELENRLAGQSNPMTVPPAPESSPEHAPGSLVKVHEDKRTGDVIYQKVRWRKADIERVYGMTTFVPSEEMTIGINSVFYQLHADVETTVPTCIKDEHDRQRKARIAEGQRYAYKVGEANEVSEKAVMNPGQRIWSKVSRLGVGINVNPDEGFPA